MLKNLKLILEIISYFWARTKNPKNGIYKTRRKPNKH